MKLAAYSCGGSRGFRQSRHRIPVSPPGGGTAHGAWVAYPEARGKGWAVTAPPVALHSARIGGRVQKIAMLRGRDLPSH